MALTADLVSVLRVGWTGGLPHTKNGPGSVPAVTEPLVALLPAFLRKHGITSMADMGCGDLSWMRQCDLKGIDYVGYDYIMPPRCELRAMTANIFERQKFAECAFARHVMIHFTDAQCQTFLTALNAKYLLATNDIHADNIGRHEDNKYPSYSPINLTRRPFGLRRIDAIPEHVAGQELALFLL